MTKQVTVGHGLTPQMPWKQEGTGSVVQIYNRQAAHSFWKPAEARGLEAADPGQACSEKAETSSSDHSQSLNRVQEPRLPEVCVKLMGKGPEFQ